MKLEGCFSWAHFVFRRLSISSTKQITLISVFICCTLCHVNCESCSNTMEDELCVSEIMLILKGSGDNMCNCSASPQK